MPKPTFVNCAFDPNLCPLLKGLSPDEQKARMAEDPLIRNCISHLSENGGYPSQCSDLNANTVRAAKARLRKVAASA